MPNLNQIYSLKQRFYRLTEQDKIVRNYLDNSVGLEVLEKAFTIEGLNDRYENRRAFAILNESLQVGTPELIKYFEEGKEEDVALLFIDISSFSKTIKGYNNKQIKDYLDDYYSKIIPIIYECGGEIEKLMGDGIICVFGKPFLNLENPEYVYKAEECAEKVIRKFYGTNKNVKVAIHKGSVNYYKVPSSDYGEYTIIGQPLTDLYRLESVSLNNAINFYSKSAYDGLGWKYSIFVSSQFERNTSSVSLQGVEFVNVHHFKFLF